MCLALRDVYRLGQLSNGLQMNEGPISRLKQGVAFALARSTVLITDVITVDNYVTCDFITKGRRQSFTTMTGQSRIRINILRIFAKQHIPL